MVTPANSCLSLQVLLYAVIGIALWRLCSRREGGAGPRAHLWAAASGVALVAAEQLLSHLILRRPLGLAAPAADCLGLLLGQLILAICLRLQRSWRPQPLTPVSSRLGLPPHLQAATSPQLVLLGEDDQILTVERIRDQQGYYLHLVA